MKKLLNGEIVDVPADEISALTALQEAISVIAFVLDYENAVQATVDQAAREKQFRDGVTMASYVASTNPQWAAEAQAFVGWRDRVWSYAYLELAKVQAGERYQPSIEDFLSEIEPIIWPTADGT